MHAALTHHLFQLFHASHYWGSLWNSESEINFFHGDFFFFLLYITHLCFSAKRNEQLKSSWDTLVRLASVERAHANLTILCCFRDEKKTFIRTKHQGRLISAWQLVSNPAPCIVRSQHVFHNSSNAAFLCDLQQPSYHTSGSLSVLPGVIPQLTFTAQWSLHHRQALQTWETKSYQLF